MGWGEFTEWLRAMHREVRREREAHETTPDSWRNADSDPKWVEMRRIRDEARRPSG